MPAHRLELDIRAQPTNTTCGPTCLHAVYNYWGDEIPLDEVVAQVADVPGGGTLATNLAHHALRRGYRATLFTYHLRLFDPTWFPAAPERLIQHLEQQLPSLTQPRDRLATEAYLEYLRLGGEIRFEELRPRLLQKPLLSGVPILTGLSATYLYSCARERDDDYDPVSGEPQGHFVVLCGYEREGRRVEIADPMHDNTFQSQYYDVGINRLIGAILLGVVTYDANLLLLQP